MKNKPSLLYYISVCLTLLLFCSIIFIFILVSKLNSDKNRFNTLAKQIEKVSVYNSEISQELSKQQFKEDYFIEQQSNDTTLILSVFAITVVFFGFFSYALFESRINEHKNYYTKKIKEQDSKYAIYENHLKELSKNIASNSGYENLMKSKKCLNDNEYDWFVYFVFEALSNFSDYYVIIKEQEFTDELQTIILNNQINTLKEALKKIEKIKNIKDLDPTVTNQYVNNIRRFNSVEINKLISKLHSHLSD